MNLKDEYRNKLLKIDTEIFDCTKGVSTAYILDIIYDETVEMNPNLIIEIGVRRGVSTVAFEHASKACNSKLVGIDIKESKTKFCKWKDWIFILSRGQTVGRRFNTIRKKYNLPNTVDVLFIDSEHSYNDTITLLDIWTKLLSNKHKIIFHDTNPILHKEKYGVKKAIVEFINEDWDETKPIKKNLQCGYQLTHYPQEHGLTVLKMIKEEE